MTDAELIQIVGLAVAAVEQRSGAWIACRPGCTDCCIGAFTISLPDASRLRRGLAELEERDPERARAVRDRARDWWRRLSPEFPGDASTGWLDESEEAEARFDGFAEEEPCPALDPRTGTCDLYTSRPLTCRVFGPAMRLGRDAVGACELCYRGATAEEVAACAAILDTDALEAELAPAMSGGKTVIAAALVL